MIIAGGAGNGVSTTEMLDLVTKTVLDMLKPSEVWLCHLPWCVDSEVRGSRSVVAPQAPLLQEVLLARRGGVRSQDQETLLHQPHS